MTRDDIITAVHKKGYSAKARDWVMGKTVYISHDSLTSRVGDPPITVYSRAAYLKTEGDKWVALWGHQMKTCVSFDEAWETVQDYLGVA